MQNVSIDSMSLAELKALHYDVFKDFSRNQQNLQIIIAKIDEIEKKEAQLLLEAQKAPVTTSRGD